MSVISHKLSRADEAKDQRGRVTIAPMKKRHLRAIMPLEAAAYPTSWSRAVFEGELDQVSSGNRHYVVALDGRTVVGYAGLWFVPDPDGDQAHVTNIVVDGQRRREGIARRLMIHLAEHARSRGCVAWTLEVRANSEGAQALYRQMGFAPAGLRKRYYDNHEDAIVMWCHDMHTDEYAARLSEMRTL